MRTQVAFDTTDPHAQAHFWAEVLGLEVEDHANFVDQLVSDGRLPAAERVILDDGRSAFRDVAACRDPRGTEPRLFFQRRPREQRVLPALTASQPANVPVTPLRNTGT